MDTIPTGKLHKLLAHRQGPCISIYLPFARGESLAPRRQVGITELMLRARRVLQRYYPATEETFLASLMEADVARLAKSGARGVAMFKSATLEGLVPTNRSVQPMAVVANSFHVTPILSAIQQQTRFFLLHVGDRLLRVMEGDESGLVSSGAFKLPVHDDQDSRLRLRT